MKHISILIPTGSVLGSIEGPRLVLTEVNKFLAANGKSDLGVVQLVGLKSEVSAAGGKYNIYPDALIKDVAKTDLIIIPALDGDLEKVLEENRDFIPWIVQQYK